MFVLDTGLGYSVNPLMNVLAGFLFLRERPTRPQDRAIALVCVGVLWSVIGRGAFLRLALAVSPAACSHVTRKTMISM